MAGGVARSVGRGVRCAPTAVPWTVSSTTAARSTLGLMHTGSGWESRKPVRSMAAPPGDWPAATPRGHRSELQRAALTSTPQRHMSDRSRIVRPRHGPNIELWCPLGWTRPDRYDRSRAAAEHTTSVEPARCRTRTLTIERVPRSRSFYGRERRGNTRWRCAECWFAHADQGCGSREKVANQLDVASVQSRSP